jgi:hypothetical protein
MLDRIEQWQGAEPPRSPQRTQSDAELYFAEASMERRSR